MWRRLQRRCIDQAPAAATHGGRSAHLASEHCGEQEGDAGATRAKDDKMASFVPPSAGAHAMTDDVELIPVTDQDVEEAVFRAWEDGKGPQALSRQFAIPIRQVEEIIDRMLPVFDTQSQLRAFKRELRRSEDLSGEFFAIAKRDKNHESAHLVARLNERICAMRGIGPMNMCMGPLAAEVAQQPSSHDRIYETIMRLARPGWQPNSGDGAVDALSPSDDTKPSNASTFNRLRARPGLGNAPFARSERGGSADRRLTSDLRKVLRSTGESKILEFFRRFRRGSHLI
jgi:hypothetical protein